MVRRSRGISMSAVAAGIGCSRQLIGVLEHRRLGTVDPILLARYCAAVGLDLSMRAHPGGAPLRDAPQLRLLARLQAALGTTWAWRTEVPVSTDPYDRRAIDAVLARERSRVGVEAIARLEDAQTEARGIGLKQQAAGLACMVILLADTRHNRYVVRAGAPTLDPMFPLRGRVVMSALRAGHAPPANGIVLL